ncbi:hypothetical protein ACXN5S_14630 [Pseudoroseicyclus sp. H15]
MVTVGDPAATRGWFDALAEGDRVRMELESNFFSAAYGSLTACQGNRRMAVTVQPEG